MGIIYKITNKINGKSYIGQSQQSDTLIKKSVLEYNRIKEHIWSISKSNGILYRAIRKYGLENFSIEILRWADNSVCDFWEIYYISKYDTLAPNGYNLSEGGRNAGVHQDTREKLRDFMIAYFNRKGRVLYECPHCDYKSRDKDAFNKHRKNLTHQHMDKGLSLEGAKIEARKQKGMVLSRAISNYYKTHISWRKGYKTDETEKEAVEKCEKYLNWWKNYSIDNCKKYPSQNSKDKQERTFYNYIEYLKEVRSNRRGIFYQKVYDSIIGYGLGYLFYNEEEKALEKVKEMVAYWIELKGDNYRTILPSQNSKDEKECVIYAWIVKYTCILRGTIKDGNIYESIGNFLEEKGLLHWVVHPTYDEKAIKKWRERVQMWKDECSKNGTDPFSRRPSQVGKNKDGTRNAVECKIGKHISDYNCIIRGTSKSGAKRHPVVEQFIRNEGFNWFIE
jgi:group I intron endonuclease